MPPKAKYTREEIIETALNIVAEKGKSALNARDLGAALGTSTRPDRKSTRLNSSHPSSSRMPSSA